MTKVTGSWQMQGKVQVAGLDIAGGCRLGEATTVMIMTTIGKQGKKAKGGLPRGFRKDESTPWLTNGWNLGQVSEGFMHTQAICQVQAGLGATASNLTKYIIWAGSW